MSQLFSFDAPLWCGQIEDTARTQGLGALIGLDEAGRGPLAGPVSCAACVLPDPCPIEGLDDSKKLSERRREALFDAIVDEAIAFSVVLVEPDVIDHLNILHASLYGMAEAWRDVVARFPSLGDATVLVDGNKRAPLPEAIDQRTIVKGDARSLNVAAASILAKVSRDRLMIHLDAVYPGYGLAKHKGYPTKVHREALRRLGPTPIHRRSFKLPDVEKG